MRQGYIKLWRKSVNNPLFQKPLTWHYWQYCLIKANHEPKKIVWNKKEMIIEKGSFITGRKKASQETGLSERNIRTAIDTLVNLEMIVKSTTKSTTKFTYLTICNYDKYQQKNDLTDHQTDQQATSKRPASDHKQALISTKNTNKNIKAEDKKEKYLDFVLLTKAEYEKLINKYSEAIVKSKIQDLNDYIGSKGKKYKSHYFTILSWLRKDDNKQRNKEPRMIIL